MHQRGATLTTRDGKVMHGQSVDSHREVGFFLGEVDVVVRRGVDDPARRVMLEAGLDGVRVGDVEFTAAEPDDAHAAATQLGDDLGS